MILAPGGLIKLDPSANLCLVASIHGPEAGDITLDTWCERRPPLQATRFHLSSTVKVAGGCLTVEGQYNDATPIWALPSVGGYRNQLWEYYW